MERHKAVERQDCVEAQIWGRLQKNPAALKVLKNTVASIILKGQKFGKNKLNYWRIRVREVKTLMITLLELQRSCLEMGGQPLSDTPPVRAFWESGEMTASPKCMTHEITKKHLKDFHTEKNKIICCDSPLFQASFPEETSAVLS